jgi:hypothetical protein
MPLTPKVVSPKTLENYPYGDWKRAMQKKLFF